MTEICQNIMLSPVPEEVEEDGGNCAPVVDVGEYEGVRRKPEHIELNACHQPMLRGCFDVSSTHGSTTYDSNPNVLTLSPKSGRIVHPTKIVTLRPQKVGRSVTVEHYHPLVFYSLNCL